MTASPWVYQAVTLTDPSPPPSALVAAVLAASSAITGPRLEGWQLDAITPAGQIVCTLPMVKDSGQHDWQLDRPNPLGLSCTVGDRLASGDPLPDLRGLWLRATHRINGVSHLLATVVVTGAPRALTSTTSMLRLTGVDPTVLLSVARLRKQLTLPVATPIAETVRSLIATYTPLVTASIGDTDETLRTILTFEAGTPVLEVVTKLLEAAAYTRLAPRPDGSLWTTQWTPQSDRPTELTFNDSGMAPFLPDLELDDNYLTAPNEVIALGKGGQDMPPVAGRWPDAPPLNPVTEVIDVDATSIEAARMQARRYFDTARGRARRTTVRGPWQPITPGEVAGFTYGRHDVSARFELTGLRTQWATRSPTDYTLQEA